MIHRRDFVSTASALAASVVVPGQASARIDVTRLVTGFAAGTGSDLVARKLAALLQAAAGTPFIVENIPGAAGRMAASQVKNAAPDGRSILFAPGAAITLLPHLHRNLGYKPLEDLAPVTLIATLQLGLVIGPAGQGKTLAEYLDWVRRDKPNGTYATPGVGSVAHFVGVMLAKATGLDLVHVAYRGAAPAQQDLLGGQVPAYIGSLGRNQLGDSRLRVLALAREKRSVLLPDVPSFAEAGLPAVRANEWSGLFLPARTPVPLVEALNKQVLAVLQTSALRSMLADSVMEVAGVSPAEFAAQVKREYAAWAQVVRSSGFKPED